MANPSKLTSRKKERNVLDYNVSRGGALLQTRVDLTLEGEGGSVIPTPVTPLYAARLQPFFNVPSRPNELTLRRLVVCTTDNGTRTVYIPYTSSDPTHNDMIREYTAFIPDMQYEGLRYEGERLGL